MKETELKPKYVEIQMLYHYCISLGIKANLEELYDGYKICFPNGGDFVQHQYSYSGERGCVEPAIFSRLDYQGISLDQAKALVRYHKVRLNRRSDNEQRKAD